MLDLLTVTLEAHHREKNHHRHYQITVGRDLLDDWTVAIRYGRTGQAGRELRYAAAEADALRAIIRDRLRRRLSAPKRIGCPYRLAAFSAAPGFDAASWLPGEVMAGFFNEQGDRLTSSSGRITSRARMAAAIERFEGQFRRQETAEKPMTTREGDAVKAKLSQGRPVERFEGQN